MPDQSPDPNRNDAIPPPDIPEDVLKKLFRHLEDCHPDEGCGLILAPAGRLTSPHRYRPCQNAQNELHAQDPDLHPRTARNAFAIPPNELLAIDRELRERNEKILAICHSHPDADVYFSEEDHRRAVVDGNPLHPDTFQVVVSVRGGRAEEFGVFAWSPREKNYRIIRFGRCDQSFEPGPTST